MSRCIVSAGVFALLVLGGCGSDSQSSVPTNVVPAAQASKDALAPGATQRVAEPSTTQPADHN
ncbi:MAG TPA: hypothetical protein VHP11_13085, partial [Tepidisphaeraceae bacterium]|nr:hypothetical protein [Tepidisphaeraceae bacterium]